MKLAYCTEDQSDEHILHAIVERVLGPTERHSQQYRFDRGGWTKALQLAPIVARAVHRSNADGAVFAIDNDEGEPIHHMHGEDTSGCRHCALVRAAAVEQVHQWPRPGLSNLHFFFVVPVRVIESWLLLLMSTPFPGDPLRFGRTAAERRELKRLVWGTERPDQELMNNRGRELIAAANLSRLSQQSPSFATFHMQLASVLARAQTSG